MKSSSKLCRWCLEKDNTNLEDGSKVKMKDAMNDDKLDVFKALASDPEFHYNMETTFRRYFVQNSIHKNCLIKTRTTM